MPETSTIKILDTTIGENGPAQNIPRKLLSSGLPIRFHVDLGSGDVLYCQSKLEGQAEWKTMEIIDEDGVYDIFPSPDMRFIRTTDGGTQDSQVYALDYWSYVDFVAHSA